MSQAKSKTAHRTSNPSKKGTTGSPPEPEEISKAIRQRAAGELNDKKLYIVLWIRYIPRPKDNDFYWGFYYHKATRGKLYHLAQGKDTWIPQHDSVNNFMDAKFLCVLIAIGIVPEEKEEQLDKTIKGYDKLIHENRLTERPEVFPVSDQFWVCERVVPDLVRIGLIHCDNTQTVSRECAYIGNLHKRTAALGLKPRPIRFLTSCHW